MSTADAVRLDGIEKTFRSPAGPVHAVRGVDVAIDAGETVALLGPNGAGKSTTIDMLLGLRQARRRHRLALRPRRRPRRSARAGRRDAADRRRCIRDLTVRELVTMIASLYPAPLGVDEVLELVGIDAARRAAHAEALRRRDPARALRARARHESRAARARRADGGDGRRGAPRVLDDDARVRGARARPCSSRRTTSRRPTPTPTASS